MRWNHKDALGGGFKFVYMLEYYLRSHDDVLTYEFKEKHPPNLILMMDPRKSPTRQYSLTELIQIKSVTNNRLVYRVNECDSKRETSINIEPQIVKAIESADVVVYVSEWLRGYYHHKYPNLSRIKSLVIFNGVDTTIYRQIETKVPNKIPLIVTHHWSNNGYKGYDFYNELDDHAGTSYRFMFIGRPHPKQRLNKTIHHQSIQDPKRLAKLLSEADVYLTASQNEPSGNHFMEGLALGLPVLYRHSDRHNSGGIHEMASKMGESFRDFWSFRQALEQIITNYERYRERIRENYHLLDVNNSLQQYHDLFHSLK